MSTKGSWDIGGGLLQRKQPRPQLGDQSLMSSCHSTETKSWKITQVYFFLIWLKTAQSLLIDHQEHFYNRFLKMGL